ncbi:MAG: ABC transporter ATP-binding protein [Candidatus Faecousia sp.]|nr:ABC transporter ATP-binding protein [Clostridiales bacterium]MDY2809586.1 ABC transporter ATP-binding protein [Candidatus Faecousia sp.]
MEVRLEHISKKYGSKYALRDFTATLENGVYGLLGTNGAGKTTLINAFMGIIPAQGDIFINGTNIRSLGSDFLSNIGYLPQYPKFYRDFSVREFLRYMCVLKGIDQADARIDALLDTVNLADAAGKKIGALSGGMRQRLGIAQAMLSDPGILILDEPTAGLDPRERIRFRNLISQFSENRIVILATHIVSDVEFIANKILLLHQGELLKFAPPTELCRELDGKVWALTLAEPDVPASLVHHTISNLAREENGIRLRILSETQPHPDARPVEADLEEVFLYHCGEETQ